MRPELDAKLCEVAPNLYRNRYADPRTTAMCWGFDCGDGWFDLLLEASIKLEALIVALPEADREYCCASQVKEKFGTLRFYMHGFPPGADEIIDEAERRSARECEECGKRGRTIWINSWASTMCLTHLRAIRSREDWR
jgi:hypothetical protein